MGKYTTPRITGEDLRLVMEEIEQQCLAQVTQRIRRVSGKTLDISTTVFTYHQGAKLTLAYDQRYWKEGKIPFLNAMHGALQACLVRALEIKERSELLEEPWTPDGSSFRDS